MNIVAYIKKYLKKKKIDRSCEKYCKVLFAKKEKIDGIYEVKPSLYQKIFLKKKKAFERDCTLVFFGTREYVNPEVWESLLAQVGRVHILVLTDAATYASLDNKFVKAIQKDDENKIFILPEEIALQSAMGAIAKYIPSRYILFVTGDSLIRKNLQYDISEVLASDTDVIVPEDVILEDGELDYSLSFLSGLCIKKEVWKTVFAKTIGRYCVAKEILVNIDSLSFSVYTKKLICKVRTEKYSNEIFAHIARDIQRFFTGGQTRYGLNLLLHAAEQILHEKKISKQGMTFCAGTLIYYLLKYNLDTEENKEKINEIFYFGKIFEDKKVQRIYAEMVLKLVKHIDKHPDILVIENYGMDDIKNSAVYKELSEKYVCLYIKKRTNFDYYALNNMVLQMYSACAKIVLSTGSLNKTMLSKGAKLITLWHGLGLLKETVVKKEKFTVGTIICSSTDCEPYYAKHFHAEKAKGFGSIQTDILYDSNYVYECREKIRAKYNLTDEKLVFFAPTFRIGKVQYYDFGMDINSFAEKLREKNIVCIAKRHYIFDSVFAMTHTDMSGLNDSENGNFRVDTEYSFTELVSACDTFMTDYSSGIFYATVLRKPLVLYAPDYQEYKKGKNGFILPYPESIPAQAVLVPKADALVSALTEPQDTYSPAYNDFFSLHVGACDGHVNERVYEYIKQQLIVGHI